MPGQTSSLFAWLEENFSGTLDRVFVETQPYQIDIEFVAGPEAGNWNFGIFRLESDQLEICLDMNGKLRPDHFSTSPGSGRAYETLRRTSTSRPDNVTGGTAPNEPSSAATQDSAGFEFVESATLTKLEGQWTPVKIVRDGEDLPSMMLRTGLRIATKNEVKISMGGRTMIHVIVRINERTEPMQVDYYNLDGMFKGALQHGLLKWSGSEACFCMAAPGNPRPDDFTAPSGSGRTLSQWRPKK